MKKPQNHILSSDIKYPAMDVKDSKLHEFPDGFKFGDQNIVWEFTLRSTEIHVWSGSTKSLSTFRENRILVEDVL